MQLSWQYPHVHQHVVWQVEQKIPGWKSNLVFCLARRGKAALCGPRAPHSRWKKKQQVVKSLWWMKAMSG
jgi:hypothetical protein